MASDVGSEHPDDDDPMHPRPDPRDRAWVHPSELRSFVPASTTAVAPPPPREWIIGLTSAVAAVVVTVLVLVAFGAIGGRDRSPIKPPALTRAGEPIDYATASRVYQSLALSVITVRSVSSDRTNTFSGVVTKSNRVITTAHMISPNAVISVVARDNHVYPATLMGTDPDNDLALLDLPNADLDYAQLATNAEPDIGTPIVAVGAGKVNAGWVDIDVLSQHNATANEWGLSLVGLYQVGLETSTDNVGGALADTLGRVVGILAVPYNGTTLVVPIAAVRDAQDQIENTGAVVHAWFGAQGEDETRPGGGAVIRIVDPNGPAAKAGIKVNDIVTSAGNETVRSYADLVAQWRRRRPGDTLSVTLRSGTDMKTVNVNLSPPPAR